MTTRPGRIARVELELEIEYVGLTDQEIRDRSIEDQVMIVAAIHAGTTPVLPNCIKAFRLVNYGSGPWFPDQYGSGPRLAD